MSDTLTITLTGRRPVQIAKSEWPMIASNHEYDGEHECQANRHERINVRQHADGRTLVYGVYSTAWANESDRRRGELLDFGEDIPTAIHRVAESMEFEPAFAECVIADLPAEEL